MDQHPIPRSGAGPGATVASALHPGAALDYLRRNAKPNSQWRVGLEYELLGFEEGSYQRISRIRVQELLRSLTARHGEPVLEGANITALRMPYGDVTLEPGGQIEFSGAPERTLDDGERGLRSFLTDLREHATARGVFFVALGFDPMRTLDEQSWIDKRRYRIMRPYLRLRGGHAWDMMTCTAATQVSLDYGDERDLAKKYVLGNRLGPIVAAMFANSPYAGGALSGLKSTRYAVWLDTDPDRTGPGPATLDERFDLRAAAQAMLCVPAFFVMRDGRMVDRAGLRLDQMEDARAEDFPDLLGMIFTEARIREYVEMRSADGGRPVHALALMALWKGLTYDAATLDDALAIAPRPDPAGFRALQMAVARDALAGRCEGVDVLATARAVVSLARAGLNAIAPAEVRHLDWLSQNVMEDGVSPADVMIRDFGANVERATYSARVA